MDKDQRDEACGWLDNASRFGGDFVKAFALAVMRADSDNFEILLPALNALRGKYPKYEEFKRG